MATTNNFSGLTNAVEIRKDELIVKASMGAETLKTMDIYPNIAGKTLIPTLDASVAFQDGAKCSFDPNGSDTWGEVELNPGLLKVDKSWCFRTVNQKFEAWNVKVAIGLETAPYEDKFIDAQLGAINEALDVAIWSGVTGVMTGLTAQFDAASGVTIAPQGLSTGSTIDEKIDAIVAAIPAKAFKMGEDGKVRIYLSHSNLTSYIGALNGKCCGKIAMIDGSVDELVYPGNSKVILTPVWGLEGLGYIVAVPAGSLAYGTNVEGSENIYRFKQDEKTDEFFLKVAFTAGVAIKLPSLSVVYKA